MKHNRWVVLLAAVMAIALLGAPDFVSAQAASSQGEEVACVDCSECLLGGQFGNKAFEGDETSVHARGSGTHSQCIASGTCQQQHPYQCSGGFAGVTGQQRFVALIDQFAQAVLAGDDANAGRIAASADYRIMYVAERRAVQVLGCAGQIVAHIPLREVPRAGNLAMISGIGSGR